MAWKSAKNGGAIDAIWKTNFGAIDANWKTNSEAIDSKVKTSSRAVDTIWKTSFGAVDTISVTLVMRIWAIFVNARSYSDFRKKWKYVSESAQNLL